MLDIFPTWDYLKGRDKEAFLSREEEMWLYECGGDQIKRAFLLLIGTHLDYVRARPIDSCRSRGMMMTTEPVTALRHQGPCPFLNRINHNVLDGRLINAKEAFELKQDLGRIKIFILQGDIWSIGELVTSFLSPSLTIGVQCNTTARLFDTIQCVSSYLRDCPRYLVISLPAASVMEAA